LSFVLVLVLILATRAILRADSAEPLRLKRMAAADAKECAICFEAPSPAPRCAPSAVATATATPRRQRVVGAAGVEDLPDVPQVLRGARARLRGHEVCPPRSPRRLGHDHAPSLLSTQLNTHIRSVTAPEPATAAEPAASSVAQAGSRVGLACATTDGRRRKGMVLELPWPARHRWQHRTGGTSAPTAAAASAMSSAGIQRSRRGGTGRLLLGPPQRLGGGTGPGQEAPGAAFGHGSGTPAAACKTNARSCECKPSWGTVGAEGGLGGGGADGTAQAAGRPGSPAAGWYGQMVKSPPTAGAHKWSLIFHFLVRLAFRPSEGQCSEGATR
jgi:hypothetical protein